MTALALRPFVRPLLITAADLLALLLLAVVALYLWPLDNDRLRPAARQLSYADAQARITAAVDRQKADPTILPECRSQALLHGGATAKAVLLLHGYHDCPVQYRDLAQRFYKLGYNVYVPLAPLHGNVDPHTDADVRAQQLADYAGESMDIVAALGAETGIVGISGGGVLATYLTTTRPQQVRHLLAISPFYRPAAGQAPGVLIKPLLVLFGFHLVPDRINGNDFSFAALSQYLRLTALTRTGGRLPKLSSVAVVTSANDTFIDRGFARKLPAEIAAANHLQLGEYEIPAETGVGHDAVGPEGLRDHENDLYARYLDLYEGVTGAG